MLKMMGLGDGALGQRDIDLLLDRVPFLASAWDVKHIYLLI